MFNMPIARLLGVVTEARITDVIKKNVAYHVWPSDPMFSCFERRRKTM